MVSASEIAAFVYCPEAWRLEHGLGLEAENREAMAAGERHHGRKAAAERVGGRVRRHWAAGGRPGGCGAASAVGALPMTATAWVAAGAVLALLLGLLLVLLGRGMRQRRGLGEGRTVSLDNVVLTSRRLGLTGRPDRLIRAGSMVIAEGGNPPGRYGRGTGHRWAATSC